MRIAVAAAGLNAKMRVNFGREGASLVLWACSRVGRGRGSIAEHVSDEITLCATVGLCAEILVPAQASQRATKPARCRHESRVALRRMYGRGHGLESVYLLTFARLSSAGKNVRKVLHGFPGFTVHGLDASIDPLLSSLAGKGDCVSPQPGGAEQPSALLGTIMNQISCLVITETGLYWARIV